MEQQNYESEIQKFREKLVMAWSEKTRHPGTEIYVADPKSRGQCYVTAYLFREKFHGNMVKGKMNWRGKSEDHWWNQLPNGNEYDLTSDQYGGDGLHPVANGMVKKPNSPSGKTKERIDILKEALKTNQETIKGSE